MHLSHETMEQRSILISFMPIQFYRIGQTGEPCRVQNKTTSYSAKIVHGQNLFVLFNKFPIKTDAAVDALLWAQSKAQV